MQSGAIQKHASGQDRNLELALHHARIIQQQKEVETEIIRCIEELLELPNSPEADSKNPSLNDASVFLNLLDLFQPNHYDDLIEERQAAGLCGYVLCPKTPRRAISDFQVVKGPKRGEVNIVSKADIEKWCSDDCGRRALYVKAQLSKEPSWARPTDSNANLKVFGTVQSKLPHHGNVLPATQRSASNIPPSALSTITDSMASLALERGDTADSWRASQLISSSIVNRVGDSDQ